MLDPQDDGLSDIPDYNDLEDEAFPPLPPPYSPGHEGDQEQGEHFGAEQGDLSKLADVPAVKPKGVKRPQPKLDSQRLTSERGLPALRTLFENIRFKGKGHEAEDLRLLMQKMENWAHRLFPKLQFEDFIEKVEKLGSKKEVQTCLKRVRLDMPLTHEDFQDKDAEAQPADFQAFEVLDPFSSESAINVHSTPDAAPSLTEEQLNQIQLNRQRAMERKLARQHQMANVLNVSTEQDEKPEDLDLSSTPLPLCPATTDVEPPAASPAEPPAECPAEPPAECPAEPLAECPAEPLAECPAEPPAECPAEPPAECPAEPLAECPAECPAESPAEPLAECPAEPPADSTPCERSESLESPLSSRSQVED